MLGPLLLAAVLGRCGAARGTVDGSGSGLFAAFPPPAGLPAGGPSETHFVTEAESVQLVGTVDAAALRRALRRLSDGVWQPLEIAAKPRGNNADADDEEAGGRALLSVGIGSFANTSAGPYRELAVAFPACQVPAGAGAAPPRLGCRSFLECQDRQPDCTHTYMLQSMASGGLAVAAARSAGVDSEEASIFEYENLPPTAEAPGTLSFEVRDQDGAEVLAGAVETSPPTRPGHEAGSTTPNSSPFNAGAGPGFRLQLFAGPPGVLGEAGAKHVCAFPDDLDARPARTAKPLRAGELFASLDFKVEGAFHVPNLRLVRLPPWGHGGGAAAAPRQASGKRIPKSCPPCGRGASSGGKPVPAPAGRAPWVGGGGAGRLGALSAPAEGAAQDALWQLHGGDRADPTAHAPGASSGIGAVPSLTPEAAAMGLPTPTGGAANAGSVGGRGAETVIDGAGLPPHPAAGPVVGRGPADFPWHLQEL